MTCQVMLFHTILFGSFQGFIPPRLVRPRPAEEEAPAPEPDFPENYFYGNVASADCSSVPDWTGKHADSFSQKSLFRGLPDNPSDSQSDRSSAKLFSAVQRLSGDAPCHRSTPASAVFVGRDRSPAGEVTERNMESSFGSPSSLSPRLASVTRNSAWRTFGPASSHLSPVLYSQPPGGAFPSVGRDQNAGQEVKSKWNQFIPDASTICKEPSSSVPHKVKFPAGFSSTKMEAQKIRETPLGPGGNELTLKRSTSEIMALLGKKSSSSSVSTARKLSASGILPTTQAPLAESSHSNDILPCTEPNHSSDFAPPAEPSHSSDFLRHSEPSHSSDLVPPTEPSHQAAHLDGSPESPTCRSPIVEDETSHLRSLRTVQQCSPRLPSNTTPQVVVSYVPAQRCLPHFQVGCPASEKLGVMDLASKSSCEGSPCPQPSDEGACTSTLKSPLSETQPAENISGGWRTGCKKSDEKLPQFPSAENLVPLNENRSSKSDLSHSSPRGMRTLMSPRLSASTPSLSKHDFEEEEGCFEEETFSGRSVANNSQCLSDFDFPASALDAETPCQQPSPVSKGEEVRSQSVQSQDPDTERNGNSFGVKQRQHSTGAAEDFKPCGESESPVEGDWNSFETKTKFSSEDVTTQISSEAQPRGAQETHPIENAEEYGLDECFEMSLSPLSEEAERDNEDFQNSGQDAADSGGEDCRKTQHSEHISSCTDQNLLAAKDRQTAELPESSSERNLALALPPEGQCWENVKENLDVNKAGNKTEGRTTAEQLSQPDAVVNKNVCDHAERLGEEDQVTHTLRSVTKCYKAGLMTGESTDLKECGHLGKERCELKDAAEVNDALKTEGMKKSLDQPDLETEEESYASKPEMMEANAEQAGQSELQQIVSQTLNTGESYALHSDSKPVSICCDDSQKVVDNMKTLSDLDISPDFFVYDQQSEQPPSEDAPPGSVSDNKPYTLETKENKQTSSISEQDDAKEEICVSQSQTQSQTQMQNNNEGKTKMLCPKEWTRVDAVTSSSISNCSLPPDFVSTKLATPSSLSCVSDQSLSFDSDAVEDTHKLHSTVVNSWNTVNPQDQVHLPVSFKRPAVSMSESMRSKVPRRLHAHSSGLNHSTGPQNTPDDGDPEPDHHQLMDDWDRLSPPLPVHRIFQTVSEVLGDRERNMSVFTSDSFCRDDFEDPTSMLQQERVGKHGSVGLYHHHIYFNKAVLSKSRFYY